MLASRKIRVIGVDINQKAVDTINQGRIHIIEPELDILVSAAVTQGYLRATTTPEPADAFLIAVPTPFKGDFEPDLSYVQSAAVSIAPVLKRGDLVILESTSPVGTTEEMAEWLSALRPDLSFPQSAFDDADINIAYCPERVLPGKVVHELVSNDRVIGGMTKRCAERATALYKNFVDAECVQTTVRTAEMCKLTENSFRDVNIAFANELSVICEKLDINVWELINLANRHPRVNILKPGPGVGGHCIAVDPWFIVSKNPDAAKLIKTARQVNDSKPVWVLGQVEAAVAEFIRANSGYTASDVTIACFGLTFKPDIDDLRESPALSIVAELSKMHRGKVLAVEPNIAELPAQVPPAVELVSIEQALATAQIALILVDHKTFKHLTQESFKGISTINVCREDF
jgi:UDP-N-acetyl-D-mannosaminuronic acid dehydrogenase